MISLGGGGLTEGVDSGRPLGDPSGYNSWQSTLTSVERGNGQFLGFRWVLVADKGILSWQSTSFTSSDKETGNIMIILKEF